MSIIETLFNCILPKRKSIINQNLKFLTSGVLEKWVQSANLKRKTWITGHEYIEVPFWYTRDGILHEYLESLRSQPSIVGVFTMSVILCPNQKYYLDINPKSELSIARLAYENIFYSLRNYNEKYSVPIYETKTKLDQ